MQIDLGPDISTPCVFYIILFKIIVWTKLIQSIKIKIKNRKCRRKMLK